MWVSSRTKENSTVLGFVNKPQTLTKDVACFSRAASSPPLTLIVSTYLYLAFQWGENVNQPTITQISPAYDH